MSTNVFEKSKLNEAIKNYFVDCSTYAAQGDFYNAFERACQVLDLGDKSTYLLEDWHEMFGTELVDDPMWDEFNYFMGAWLDKFSTILHAEPIWWHDLRDLHDVQSSYED